MTTATAQKEIQEAAERLRKYSTGEYLITDIWKECQPSYAAVVNRDLATVSAWAIAELGTHEQQATDTGDLHTGIWFRSAASGLWYRNAGSAGSISTVIIDGVWFHSK